MKTGRVALLFLFAFGSIIIPVVTLMLVSFLTYKPPFMVEPSVQSEANDLPTLVEGLPGIAKIDPGSDQAPNAKQAIQLLFDSGGRALLIQYASEKEAGKYKDDLLDNVPNDRVTSVIDLLTYQRRDKQAYGMVFQDGSWVILSEAPTKEARTTQLEHLPFLVKQEKSIMSALLEDHMACFFIGMGLYLLLLLFAWPKVASWAGEVEGLAEVAPLDASQVKQRLLAINDQEVPFRIQQGKKENEFLVEWKYVDAKWVGLMAAGGVKSLARIRLRLDPEKSLVRAQDSNASVRWKGQGSPGGMTASLSYSWFRGIEFYHYSTEKVLGFIFKEGRLTFDQAYEYTFDRSEMKNPIIETVTRSGWTYRPVISFLLPFN